MTHSIQLFTWFSDNGMKANPPPPPPKKKWNFLWGLETNAHICPGECNIENSISRKRLGVTIVENLNFHDQTYQTCQKAIRKIKTLARILSFMPLEQRKILMSAYFCHSLGIVHKCG